MAYPEALLTEDERVGKHLHPHWITLVFPVFLLVILVAGGAFAAAVAPDWGGARSGIRIGIGAVVLVALVWWVLIPVLRWRTTHYVLTTHRLMTRVGILSHRGRDIPLNRINNAIYEQTLWERVINSGTLMVESAGEDGQEVFHHIPNADQTQQLINRLVEEDHDRRLRYGARYEAEYEVQYERDTRQGEVGDRPAQGGSDYPTQRLEQGRPPG